MRTFGIVLIVAGILLFIFNGVNFQTEKKVIDAGPIQVSKKQNNYVHWPGYAGGLAIIAGIVVFAFGSKKE